MMKKDVSKKTSFSQDSKEEIQEEHSEILSDRLRSLRDEIANLKVEHSKCVRESEAYQDHLFLEEDESDYEPIESPRDRAMRKKRDVSYLLEYKKRQYKIIYLASNYEKKYSNGFGRIIRKQTSKEVKDELDRTNRAREVAKLLNDSDVKSIGVFGEWGTGKSTFLEYIKKYIPKGNNKIIDIKATEYSDQDGVWAYLFLKMKESIKKDYILNLKYIFTKVLKGIKLSRAIINLIIVALVMLCLLNWNDLIVFCDFFDINEELARLISSDMNLLAFIALGLRLIWPFIIEVEKTMELSVDTLTSSSKRDVKEKLGYKAVIKEYIGEIIKTWKKNTFIIFVDELDRCNNNAIMSFLESIQLMEEYPSIKIIYAIDSDIILRAIEKSGIHNPHNYLKKYVDVKVDLESVNHQIKSIESIARNDYLFELDEVDLIKSAVSALDINISIRDYIHVLNFLSELKECWLKEEVFSEKYLKDEGFVLLDWLEVIPLAVFYFAGSFWPRRIYEDYGGRINNLDPIINLCSSDDYNNIYKNCPKLLMDMSIIDVVTAFNYLHSITPVMGVNP